METVDEEFTKEAMRFMTDAKKVGQAFLPMVERYPHAHLHSPEKRKRRKNRTGSLSRWYGGT